MKYICLTCNYLEEHGGRPDPSQQFIFDNYEDYQRHYNEENAPAPGYEYLVDKKGKFHLSCLTVAIPNHKSCPAHPDL